VAGALSTETELPETLFKLTPLTINWQETTPCSGASVPTVNTLAVPCVPGPPELEPPPQLHKPMIENMDRTAVNTPVALRFPMMKSP
jgi:hypothetical protein